MKSTIKPGKPIINPSKYALISNNNNDDNPEEPWVENELAYRPRSRYYMFIWSPAWVVISLVLALILVIENVYFFQRHDATNRNTFEKGFDTELEAMKSSIRLHQTRFSSAIRDHPNGTLYMAFDPSEPRYVGPPSDEIDAAWRELLKGRYIRFSDDETSWLNNDKKIPTGLLEELPSYGHSIPTSGNYGGPDMLHSLHCINALREHIDMDYYHSKGMAWLPQEYRRMHIDHCIEQLRQAILCHGDMTPVTLKAIWTDTPRWAALGQTERLHTCRDGLALRAKTWDIGETVGRIQFG